MSGQHLEQSYRCWEDCVPQGCPGHTASLDWQSVSNYLGISNGRGQTLHIQTPELEAIATMLGQLMYRVEIENALKPLFKKEPNE